MNATPSLARWVTLLLFAASAMACSTPGPPQVPDTPAQVMPQEMSGAPDWVSQSCAKHWDDEDDAKLCAVGAVSGTKNPGLARSAAVARARTEMARGLETKVEAMLKDYQSTSTGGAEFAKRASDEQYITDTSKQITDTSLSGTKFENSWVSPNGTYYAMISLDLETFENAIKADSSLPEGERTAIAERAQASFAELEAEIEKRRP